MTPCKYAKGSSRFFQQASLFYCETTNFENVRYQLALILRWSHSGILRLSYLYLQCCPRIFLFLFLTCVLQPSNWYNKPIIKPNLQLSIGTIAVICNIYKNSLSCYLESESPLTWQTGTWSMCSKSCGGGLQYRQVNIRASNEGSRRFHNHSTY